MAQLEYGYGSGFQLLRFMARHRNLLDNQIKEQIGEEGEIHWINFGFCGDECCITGDDDMKGLNFLVDIPFVSDFAYMMADIEYYMYEVNRQGSWQCWDAVFTMNDTVYLVDAKAHVSELSSGNEINEEVSAKEKLTYIKEQLPEFNVTDEWINEYYQFAKSLATTALLNKNGIKAKTLCVFFENGYRKKARVNGKLTVLSDKNTLRCEFQNAIYKEMKTLGISHDMVRNLLTPPVFIDANPKTKKI